jgi:hypothetical protein
MLIGVMTGVIIMLLFHALPFALTVQWLELPAWCHYKERLHLDVLFDRIRTLGRGRQLFARIVFHGTQFAGARFLGRRAGGRSFGGAAYLVPSTQEGCR